MTDIRTFDLKRFDPKDPDPWLALYLDQSLPIDEGAKQALLVGNRSISRRWLFPIARPLIFVFFIVVKILRGLSPRRPNLNVALHHLIYWGLKTFASPEANMLILRHFTLATEILGFIKANAGPVEIDSWPLRPTRLEDLKDNVFLQHDLNIYNFIIQLNASLRAQGRDLAPVARPDFSVISDEPIKLEPTAAGHVSTSSTCRPRWKPIRRCMRCSCRARTSSAPPTRCSSTRWWRSTWLRSSAPTTTSPS